MKSHKIYGNHIITIDDILTTEQIKNFVDLTENMGYEKATVNVAKGIHVLQPKLRNNARVNIEDVELANYIYNEIKKYIPNKLNGQTLIGLDSTFRCYRYNQGEYFDWHYDGATKKEPNVSLFTILIYLKNADEGGNTEFEHLKINSKEGSCLIFPHKLLHRGAEVISGTKYVMRSDIMYSIEKNYE